MTVADAPVPAIVVSERQAAVYAEKLATLNRSQRQRPGNRAERRDDERRRRKRGKGWTR